MSPRAQSRPPPMCRQERGTQKALGVKVWGPAVVREQQRGSASRYKVQPSKVEKQGGDEAG